MNRIVLKVNLLENNGVKIDLFHLDPRFLSKDKEYIHFSTNKSPIDFVLYSRKKLSISINSLRLPDIENYQPSQSIEKVFDTEEDRYKFLKGLYYCLQEWNDNYTAFVKDSSHKYRNTDVIISGEFWVI